jgi:PKD domain
MKLVGGIGTVAVALVLSAPAASAATWTVAAGGGSCGGADTACETIQDASDAASAASGTDVIQISPGIYAGATFDDAGLAVEGTGFVLILGTLQFDQSGTLRRVIVRSDGASPAVRVPASLLASKTVTIESSILSGSGSGAGIEAASQVFATTVQGRHVTVADAGAAPATAVSGGSPTIAFTDSIVLGGGPVSGMNNDTTGDKAALFAAPDQEFFFLRVGSPAIDAGGSQQGGETTSDVEGETRPGSGWDRGADEFINHPAAAPGLVADRAVAAPGQPVLFGAVAGPQPDADRGDGVARYRFDFGDGSGVLDTTSASATHAFAAPGRYTVTARTVDVPGAESAPSNALTITVGVGLAGAGGPDNSPPRLAITSPRRGQSIRIPRRGRTPNLRGTTSDASGVRRVELALLRRRGGSCRWYDGRRAFLRRACGNPRWFRAVIDDFAWRYVFPRSVRPAPGSYTLLARATDVLGHTTGRVTAAARTSISFRYRR